jgi:hypothetical protein
MHLGNGRRSLFIAGRTEGPGAEEVTMFIKRSLLTAALALSVGAGLQAVGAEPASAASGHSSCVGIESSEISPPDSSGEFPGGRAELENVIQDLAGQLGLAPGQIVSQVAHLHEGSHEACDEATE